MLLPSRRLLAVGSLWLLAAIPAAIWPQLLWPWGLLGALIAMLALADGAALHKAPEPIVERQLPGTLPVGVTSRVALRFVHDRRHAMRVTVVDHHPDSATVQGLPATLELPAGKATSLRYEFTPLVRGTWQFGPVEIRERGPLGLMEQQRRLPAHQTVRIYPNFAAVARYTLLATDHRLSQLGILQRRRRGEGMDFHQLREYREGDSLRQVDWKATRRMGRMISREYQLERDQQVVFLLDCGRRMTTQDDALSHFDHALNALLLLSYVALRQGDAVGLVSFASDSPRFVAPRKSPAMLNTLLNQVFDLQAGDHSPDYLQAATDLMQRVTRRSLVIVVSNLRDEDDDSLSAALRLLRQNHLVVFASLKEPALEAALLEPVGTHTSAFTFAAGCDYAQRREQALKRLSAYGALTLDVEPPKLAIALINQYLELKRTARL